MTSPLSRINAGSFFSGLMRAYSALAWPGTTVAGVNSILSMRPSSIAAMRTLRANGEAGENVSFMRVSRISNGFSVIARSDSSEAIQSSVLLGLWIASLALAMTDSEDAQPSRRDDLLPLLAQPLDA